jgi:hypothetical protein
LRDTADTAPGRVCPLRRDAEGLLEAGGSELPLHGRGRPTDQELAAVIVHAPERGLDDEKAGGVDARHPPQVEDDLTVPLAVDDVPQPVLQLGRRAGIEGSTDLNDDRSEGAAERQLEARTHGHEGRPSLW